MYEAIKRYETYVARNKRLDSKGTSTSASQQKTTSQSSGYKPQFHKTTAFIATAGGPDDEAGHPQDSSPYEDTDSQPNFPARNPHEQSTLTEAERQELLLEKLDLTGLEAWPKEQAEKAHSLLKEYHNIFSLEKHDTGNTKAAKHKIVLKDPDTPPFKERFCRIPPPQLDEVCAHLKMMLDAGVIRPSNSPWCNAVVLVRKKDGSLRFCINFRRLNSLTVKDSHPLPHICETLESLAGMAYYTTIDMNSGFWQVPIDEESKQYTAFTLGSMGLYECKSMPFGLCNTPPTFQRLMLNCLGELNLTYCLIYLDDVIIFSRTEEEHLERMRLVFDRF